MIKILIATFIFTLGASLGFASEADSESGSTHGSGSGSGSFNLRLRAPSLTLPSTSAPCLSLSGCMRLSLKPELFGVPPMGDCHRANESVSLDPDKIPVVNISEGPKAWKLLLFGAGIAPFEFLLSTSLHEGSHALMVVLATDAKVTKFKPYPHFWDDGTFVFGSVSWIGNVTPGQQALVSAAPMFLDTAVLGTHAVLQATGNLPENKYARIALFTFAAGHWVDLANHAIARHDHTDSKKIMRYFEEQHGFSPAGARALVTGSQVAVLTASGVFLVKDLIEIFGNSEKSYPQGLRPAGSVTHSPATRTTSSLSESAPTRRTTNSSMFNVQDVYVAPMVDGTNFGFMLGGRF